MSESFLYSLKNRDFSTLCEKNLIFCILTKTEISKTRTYIPKTEISKILLYLPKQNSLKDSFICLVKSLCSQKKTVSFYLRSGSKNKLSCALKVFAFLLEGDFYIFYNHIFSLCCFLLQEDFYITHKHINTFRFSL